MAAAALGPTIGKLLRDELNLPVTDDNVAMVAERINRPGSSSRVRVPVEKIDDVKQLFQSEVDAHGATPDTLSEVTPPDEEPSVDPLEKFNAWWETITWDKQNFFKVIKRLRFKKEDHGRTREIEVVRYRTANGKQRDMTVITRDRRQAQLEKGGKGVAYYLLDRETEREGMRILREFPGCPDTSTVCPICQESLFRSSEDLNNHLRNILERILQGIDVIKRPQDVKFRGRHRECWKVKNSVEERTDERSTLTDRLRLNGEPVQAKVQAMVFNKEANAMLKEFLEGERMPNTRRRKLSEMIDKAFPTTETED